MIGDDLPEYLAALNPNLKAWAAMLGMSEGTSTNPLTKCDGYDVIVTGIDANGRAQPEVFTDFSRHPFAGGREPKVINSHGLESDAAGKFQLMERYWAPYKLQLALPDFGPVSQIKIMVQQVKECHALDDILTGHFQIAVGKCVSRWASLPGANYHQHENLMSALENAFESAGGTFA